MNSAFSVDKIAMSCSGAARKVIIEVVEQTGSTNSDLMARIGTLASPVLLVAENQTAGRGRAGRTWHMEPGKTLTFSLAWKFEQPLARLQGLPLAVGVAVADALSAWGVEARLKWPNDVLKDGSKLAGILVEAAAEKNVVQPATWAVIGIGLNLSSSDVLSQQVGNAIAHAGGLPQDRNEVVATLLNNLAGMLAQFDSEGLQAFTERWNRLHAYAGQSVTIMEGERVLQQGIARGIDSAGRLLLDTGSGEVAVMAGDVSLRPAAVI